MLKHTFIHIPTVGMQTERWLWRNNILSWEDYLKNSYHLDLPKRVQTTASLFVRHSCDALLREDIEFFKRHLPECELWRLYPEFSHKTVFLDIETTGLMRGTDYVTVIGLFDGKHTRFFVQGQNLRDFVGVIRRYAIIVTYNGKHFDIPFLKTVFDDLQLPQAHIDLRHVLGRLGYRGGLKKIERVLGIKRSIEVRRITGYDAVLLWNRYLNGEEEALKLLLRYNREDVVNLKYLMEFAYRKMFEALPLCQMQKMRAFAG